MTRNGNIPYFLSSALLAQVIFLVHANRKLNATLYEIKNIYVCATIICEPPVRVSDFRNADASQIKNVSGGRPQIILSRCGPTNKKAVTAR